MESRIDEDIVTAVVNKIEWERIFLYLDVKVKWNKESEKRDDLEFYAVNGLYKAKINFDKIKIDEDTYRLKANVTNNGENRCVPVGNYYIAVCSGDEKLAECETSYDVIQNIDDYSRNFLYGGRKQVFTTTFYVTDKRERLIFYFNMLSSKQNGMAFPKNTQLHPIKDIKGKLSNRRDFLRNIYKVYCKLYAGRSQKKTILFMTEQSDKIASNLLAVSEQMKKRGLDKEFNILYSARPAAAETQDKKSWFRLLKMLAQSDMVFLDDHAPVLDWLQLRADTTVIQLWHAGAGFKSSGYSRWGHLGCPSPVSCHRQYSYGIAGSKNIAHFFSEVWGINDERVLPTGMPRMDEYLDEEHIRTKKEELYNEFPFSKDKKVIMFAPTYRGKNKKEAYYPYELIDFDKLYEVCGDEYVVMFKMHPWVSSEVPIPEKYRDKFYDVGRYPNINDLFYVTELLITDYSSNIFEYSLMRKPMLFFAFDKIEYSFSRGFHRAYEESAPGKVCYEFSEVLKAIEEKDFEYEKVEQYVEHHFDYIDSNASDRVIDWIIYGNIPESIKAEIAERDVRNARMNELDFTPELIGEEVE